MAGTGTAHLRPPDQTLLRVHDLTVTYAATRKTRVHAVSGISLDLLEGETVGLVGESGCGKSTTGRAIAQLPRPTSGQVVYKGTDLTTLDRKDMRRLRPDIQMIYQDPISSLNPRYSIRRTLAEPLEIWRRGTGASQLQAVKEILDAVGINPDDALEKRPGQFSGGQCQRICIARALILEPKLLICDEPVSALDVSVQAQIINVLEDMKDRYGLTLLFIAHDLAVVKNVSDRVVVMYLGKLCEIGSPDELYRSPAHPYTEALLSAIPTPDPADSRVPILLKGDVPSPVAPPSGCRFRTRCPRAAERCAEVEPQIRRVVGEADHFVACHFPLVAAVEAP